MAEERILIRKIKENPCDDCGNAHYITCQSCEFKRDFKKAILRTEAIGSMAKALCMKNHGVSFCDFCLCKEDISCFGCLEMEKNNAAAALDALISLQQNTNK